MSRITIKELRELWEKDFKRYFPKQFNQEKKNQFNLIETHLQNNNQETTIKILNQIKNWATSMTYTADLTGPGTAYFELEKLTSQLIEQIQ